MFTRVALGSVACSCSSARRLSSEHTGRMSSRRPLTTYSSKRRKRSISNPVPCPLQSSSPLKQARPDEYMSLADGALRMLKRKRGILRHSNSGSNSAKCASADASPRDTDPIDLKPIHPRPSKRCKLSARVPLSTISEAGNNIQSPQNLEDGTADMDMTSVLGPKTPPRDNRIAKEPADAIMKEESDFLSPLPTSRTAKRVLAHRISSTQLKENKCVSVISDNTNMLLSPSQNDLASPFNSRPTSPNSSAKLPPKSIRSSRRINRTRSVGTDLRRKATMRSFSRAASPSSNTSTPITNRHPSLPNSQTSKNENHDWFVPAQLNRNTTGKLKNELNVDLDGLFTSFFGASPNACSTPVPKRSDSDSPTKPPLTPKTRLDRDATPRFSVYNPVSLRDGPVISLDEPTPRAFPARRRATLTISRDADSLFTGNELSDQNCSQSTIKQKPARRMTMHLSQDSIFSSALDFSVTMTSEKPIGLVNAVVPPSEELPEGSTLAPPASPIAGTSPSSSQGDELRDMFNTLGLDGLSFLTDSIPLT